LNAYYGLDEVLLLEIFLAHKDWFDVILMNNKSQFPLTPIDTIELHSNHLPKAGSYSNKQEELRKVWNKFGFDLINGLLFIL